MLSAPERIRATDPSNVPNVTMPAAMLACSTIPPTFVSRTLPSVLTTQAERTRMPILRRIRSQRVWVG